MQKKNPDTFYSLRTAGKYAKVTGQAMKSAINKKQLKAEKIPITYRNGATRMVWRIHKSDIDEYRKSKYIRDKRVVDGEKLYDINEDRWSVLHAAKVLSVMLNRPYTTAHIYYLIRYGLLRAYKRGGAWIIRKQDLVDLYEQENALEENYRQIKF